MFLRVIVLLGILLVLGAGGAVGWQYWQSLPKTEIAAEEGPVVPTGPQLAIVGQPAQSAAPDQKWMISPGGGLVGRDRAREWLKQDAFVKGRVVRLEFTAPLAALLDAGEVLPDQPYRMPFADIRAKKLAQDFCAPLIASVAAACAVTQVQVKEDSLDAAGETAVFVVEMAYALQPEGAPLPDLGTRALQSTSVRVSAEEAGAAAATPASFLAHTLSVTKAVCATSGEHCRMISLYLDWTSPEKADSRANIGWLEPLPKGMYAAPPLY